MLCLHFRFLHNTADLPVICCVQVLGLAGSGRKRLLLLWSALEMFRASATVEKGAPPADAAAMMRLALRSLAPPEQSRQQVWSVAFVCAPHSLESTRLSTPFLHKNLRLVGFSQYVVRVAVSMSVYVQAGAGCLW